MADLVHSSIPQEVRDLETRATLSHTQSGAGEMVWRRWGDPGAARHLVLCHGGAGSWTHWIKTIPALDHRCCLWVPDLPGLGDSAKPEPMTPEGCAAPVAAGVLAQVPVNARLQIVGFSWGAHVSTLAAQMLGTRVEGLTIIGCAAVGLPQPDLDFARERAGMSAAELDDVHRANLLLLMLSDPARVDRLALDLQANNVRRARFRSRTYAWTDGIARVLPHVPARLTAIWGDRDQIALPSVSARLDVLRRSHPELRAEIIAGAGHWVMYEQPDAFNASLVRLVGLD
jgi:2-hydroxy-6-oxonona-2,4-dienedioate hydrolase